MVGVGDAAGGEGRKAPITFSVSSRVVLGGRILQSVDCLSLRSSCSQVNSSLPRSACVMRVSLRRGVVRTGSMLLEIGGLSGD